MKLLLLGLVCIQVVFSQANAGHYTQTDNLKLYLPQLGFTDQLVLGEEHTKNVSVIEGTNALLKACKNDPEHWKVDNIFGRLAHTHPFSTTSCRLRSNPSLHVVSRVVDSDPKTEIHLDGHGPDGLFDHLNEFAAHKIFLKNDPNLMHQNVLRALALNQGGKKPFITNRERTVAYLNETFGLEPAAASLGNGFFRHYVHQFIWPREKHYEPIVNRLEGALFRHTLNNSIEFGVATWRQEDTRYKISGERSAGKRMKYALIHAFVAETPAGNEPAYARFAAVAGTSAISNAWHPWRVDNYAPNYPRRIAFGVSGMVVKSLWAEFGPDIKQKARHAMHR